MAFTGDDICEVFNLQPCKKVGVLKNMLKEAILDGVVKNTYEDSLHFLQDAYNLA
jgi:hypothetical protein